MKFYDDVVAERPRIEEAIRRWGWAAEHNYWWYQYYQYWYAPTQRTVYAETDRGALFTVRIERDKEYFVLFDPLAAKEDRVPLLMDYISRIFTTTDTVKIWFQLDRAERRGFLRALPKEYRSNRIYYTLTSPIHDMRQFDPALPGGHFKSMRKEMHRFYREHEVAVRDAKAYPDREELHALIRNWKKRRTNHERAMADVYHHMIDADFEGTCEARIFMVDGRAAGMNGGWMVPNRDRYYGSLGVHDFSVNNLGEMLYLEDMAWLKEKGYKEVDMGGSDTTLLDFKNKFRPNAYEEMAVFSVVRR